MEQRIFNEIKELKRKLIPDERLILFGSQARGDERPDSDWDLLVLIDRPHRSFDDYGRYGYPFAEIGWKYGVYLSTKVFTLKDWERQKPSPFYKNVEQDGIEIV